jgi:hypothetical protein
VGRPGSISVVERLIRSVKDECTRRLVMPMGVRGLRRELALYTHGYYHHRPHQGLGGRTPDEVYFSQRPAIGLPRLEPRSGCPRHGVGVTATPSSTGSDGSLAPAGGHVPRRPAAPAGCRAAPGGVTAGGFQATMRQERSLSRYTSREGPRCDERSRAGDGGQRINRVQKTAGRATEPALAARDDRYDPRGADGKRVDRLRPSCRDRSACKRSAVPVVMREGGPFARWGSVAGSNGFVLIEVAGPDT